MSTKDDSIDEMNSSETPSTKNGEDLQREEDEELRKLLLPDVSYLPLTPPSAIETNFVTYFALGIPFSNSYQP